MLLSARGDCGRAVKKKRQAQAQAAQTQGGKLRPVPEAEVREEEAHLCAGGSTHTQLSTGTPAHPKTKSPLKCEIACSSQ